MMVRHRHAERLREVADADAGLDGDRTGGLRRGLLPALAAWGVLAPAARLARIPRARRLVVDHHATPPSARAAATRAQRPVRSIASVSHGPPPV